MRLWHKDLIPVLPRQQLLGQWRECCLIAKNIAEKGTPNHILVNRIMNYRLQDFQSYAFNVWYECKLRGYACKWKSIRKYIYMERIQPIPDDEIFKGWHDNQYLLQCFYNLQEKFDCGGISDEEYDTILKFMIARGFKV